MTYHWNFGDGNTSTAKAPSHTYTNWNNTITATFTATDEHGAKTTKTRDITVYNQPPSMSITGDRRFTAGGGTTLYASGSDPDGHSVTDDSASIYPPTRTFYGNYPYTVTYTLSLTVTDEYGQTTTQTETVYCEGYSYVYYWSYWSGPQYKTVVCE